MNKYIKYIIIPSSILLFYFLFPFQLFLPGNETTFICVLLLCFVIEYFIEKAKSGEEIYMRPIAAIKAMEEAVGRSTEMGTPVLYVPGISSLDQIDTISGLIILGHVAGMTAEYEANLHVPVCVPIVMETAAGIRPHMKVYGNDYETKDGTGVRDYVHVNDLAIAHVLAMEYLIENRDNLILNLATGKGHSVMDVINKAEQITKSKINYKFTDRRKGDPPTVLAISKKVNDILKWKPRYSDLETLIQSSWKIYKN